MKNKTSNNNETGSSQQGAVRRSAFIITIDDEYLKCEFGFNPENADDICIDDIVKVLENHFKTEVVYDKCLRVF